MAKSWQLPTLHVASTRDFFGEGPSSNNALVSNTLDNWIGRLAPCPWTAAKGAASPTPRKVQLYTPQERLRRDATRWTIVQGILAPLQFAVFLVSLILVLNYLWRGTGYESAAISIVLKTMVLYLIMVTGAIWEKEVFGRYLFAPAFFWEDAVSMIVIGLHTLYIAAFVFDWGTNRARMIVALLAYAFYALNATQFVLKFRSARLETPRHAALAESRSG